MKYVLIILEVIILDILRSRINILDGGWLLTYRINNYKITVTFEYQEC